MGAHASVSAAEVDDVPTVAVPVVVDDVPVVVIVDVLELEVVVAEVADVADPPRSRQPGSITRSTRSVLTGADKGSSYVPSG